jgi:hypothetical protein
MRPLTARDSEESWGKQLPPAPSLPISDLWFSCFCFPADVRSVRKLPKPTWHGNLETDVWSSFRDWSARTLQYEFTCYSPSLQPIGLGNYFSKLNEYIRIHCVHYCFFLANKYLDGKIVQVTPLLLFYFFRTIWFRFSGYWLTQAKYCGIKNNSSTCCNHTRQNASKFHLFWLQSLFHQTTQAIIYSSEVWSV